MKVRVTQQDQQAREQLRAALVLARLARGWTQGQVGERAGMSQATVSRIEQSAYDPTVSGLQRYARAVGLRLVLTLEEVRK